MAGQIVILVSSLAAMGVIGVAVAPYFRATDAPYADGLAAVFSWLVVALVTVGLYRLYRRTIEDG